MKIIRKIKQMAISLFLYLLWKIGSKHYMNCQLWYLRHIGILIEGAPRYIAYTVSFDGTDYSLISIGTDTVISGDVRFLTHDYSIMRAAYATGEIPDTLFRIVKPINIGKNCFIGTKTLLLPGASIGDNVIIGAGSVVSGDIPSDSVAAGNPAKILYTIQDYYFKKMDRDKNYIREEQS